MQQTLEGRDNSITRRSFLRQYGIASSALTLSPFFMERFANYCRAAAPLTRVYKVKNGIDNGVPSQSIAKLWQMMGGIEKYISPTDIVVLKANAQWPNQGYTHTGCIKAVIDSILAIPGFAGEILICDNIQDVPDYVKEGAIGFNATTDNRINNWPFENWDSLVLNYYQGKPVATKRWAIDTSWTAPDPAGLPHYAAWNPSTNEGANRYFFTHAGSGKATWISCPVFQSPLPPGRMIDLKNGVWENGSHTSRRVRTICMPTLNNHTLAAYNPDPTCSDTGITSAIKCFYGISEIPSGPTGIINGYSHIHSTCLASGPYDSCVQPGDVVPTYVGQVVGTFLQQLFSPVLFITSAIYSGWRSRDGVGDAANTNTVLACENPVTLDYVSARDVISPYAPWLDPTLPTPTRQQILGCNAQGIGTIDPQQFEIVSYDFNNPTASRLDVERKIRDFRANKATEQDVRDTIKLYMTGG